ncbi:uncharacterized protein LOC111689830 isoform X1 [Lucilia cuprina]|uniref:uncharacterized protein LOC111689830 isoform X1 n=1 Tax=Lucilia cuprina TaxID=7375 RepID=UPI001F0665DC|nr:uncharacterized protein LOC111689830 isoform X1 [Lucilia cuprina]
MPARRAGGGVTTVRRKHSLGNLRRAHPASGATWNVQVVRGKMSSKCLWHACRALVLGLTLLAVGAGMATLGYYADHLSIGSEIRGNATVRVKNDLKGFHLNNFSYVGPIVMGFGGFIVVASCVMTFEARDSAAKVVPARLRAGTGSKMTVRSNQSSSASQRRAIGMQFQNTRWDQQFGVFRSSPAAEVPQTTNMPLDREALTAELVKFSKSLSASARFSPQLRRLTYTGSVPNLSTHHATHPLAYSTNLSHLLSPNHKPLLLLEPKRHRNHHRHHHHHHNNHHHHQHQQQHYNTNNRSSMATTTTTINDISNRQIKNRGTRISNSLIQRTTRESVTSATCTLLQPPSGNNKLYWHAASFDESCRLMADKQQQQRDRVAERTRRSDTAKRHVLARQKPIEQEEDRDKLSSSPLGNRRCSTMSDSSYSGRWTARCASIASRASSIDSRRIQVDLHSPEVMPKSILRSPKRYSSGPSTTPSVEKEFRSQLSVCSEPPAAIRQLSGQSSLEPCLPEEAIELADADSYQISQTETPRSLTTTTIINPVDLPPPPQSPTTPPAPPPTALPTTKPEIKSPNRSGILKKPRPDSLPLMQNSAVIDFSKTTNVNHERYKNLQRSNSSRTYDRPKCHKTSEHDDSIFYIRSEHRVLQHCNDFYDSEQVINERRSTLLKADSETALAERKLSSFSIPERILEQSGSGTGGDIEESKPPDDIVLQIEVDSNKEEENNIV